MHAAGSRGPRARQRHRRPWAARAGGPLTTTGTDTMRGDFNRLEMLADVRDAFPEAVGGRRCHRPDARTDASDAPTRAGCATTPPRAGGRRVLDRASNRFEEFLT